MTTLAEITETIRELKAGGLNIDVDQTTYDAIADELAGLLVRPNAPVKNPRAEHGTRARYVAGCAGPLCRVANTRYINEQRAIARQERARG